MSLDGLIDLPWWGCIAVTLALTHVTMAAITIFLHRHQAHRALDLHPVVAHFFRFWLWLTTGSVTKEWVAVHRKHHAKVETPEDPHSPWQVGINKVLWDGVDLYRKEAANKATLAKYGHNTPDDWIERHLYTPHSFLGLGIMLAFDLVCFGPIGLTIWAVQMMAQPFLAAGVINGLAHWWGYRNYEVADGSTNVSPWGILIAGEELHNNHHAFASSAKFSTKEWEFDIGWLYIRALETLGLAKVKKLPPELRHDAAKGHIDLETVKAVVRGRFVVLSHFVRAVMLRVYHEELEKTRRVDRETWAMLKRARRLLVRDRTRLSDTAVSRLEHTLAHNATLRTVYAMREKLADIWKSSAATQEQLVHALREWCRDAEATGIEALVRFAHTLRGYRLAALPG